MPKKGDTKKSKKFRDMDAKNAGSTVKSGMSSGNEDQPKPK